MLNKQNPIIPIYYKFEKCKCLSKKEKDILIEFIKTKYGEELIDEIKEEIKKKGYIEHDDNFNEWLQINLSFGEFEEVLDKLKEKQ